MKVFWNVIRRKSALVGTIIITVSILVSVLGPYLSPHDPFDQNLSRRLKAPSWSHGGVSGYWLGTDHLGRDIVSRVIYGSRISLLVGIISVLISGTLGVFLGLISGYYGGKLDTIIMRLADVQLSFPFILLVIAIVAAIGTSLSNIIVVFGVTGWVIYARTTRGLVLSLKEKEFVEAAKALGFKERTILFGHIFPNTLTPLIVIATVRIANVIIWESGLSFMGLGVPPPIITWGRMLADGRPYLSDAWWCATFPGIAIMVVVLGLNLLGDGLRDALDPRLSTERF